MNEVSADPESRRHDDELILVYASSVFEMNAEAEQLRKTFERARAEGKAPKKSRTRRRGG